MSAVILWDIWCGCMWHFQWCCATWAIFHSIFRGSQQLFQGMSNRGKIKKGLLSPCIPSETCLTFVNLYSPKCLPQPTLKIFSLSHFETEDWVIRKFGFTLQSHSKSLFASYTKSENGDVELLIHCLQQLLFLGILSCLGLVGNNDNYDNSEDIYCRSITGKFICFSLISPV